MNFRPPCQTKRVRSAFTLIELLVVIAIIAVLAGLTAALAGRAGTAGKMARIKGELHQLQTAIDSYQAQMNFFPPDNKLNPALNPLFYELSGVITRDGINFQTKNGSEKVTSTVLQNYFGVEGILNQAKEARAVKSFANFKAAQYAEISKIPDVEVLVAPVPTPLNFKSVAVTQPIPSKPGLNPWRYVSSSPTNNPARYDLWVDVILPRKGAQNAAQATTRVGNW